MRDMRALMQTSAETFDAYDKLQKRHTEQVQQELLAKTATLQEAQQKLNATETQLRQAQQEAQMQQQQIEKQVCCLLAVPNGSLHAVHMIILYILRTGTRASAGARGEGPGESLQQNNAGCKDARRFSRLRSPSRR
jgi:hypothetical protein